MNNIFKYNDYDLEPESLINVHKNISDNYGFEYDVKATKTGSSPPLQWFGYKFDEGTGNLYSRKDLNRDKEEIFGYDTENRLLSIDNGQSTIYNEYLTNGNIKKKPDVSELDYVYSTTRPNAVENISSPLGSQNHGLQTIEYNSLNKISHIDEKNLIQGSDDENKHYIMDFSYSPEGERNKVVFKKDNDVIFTKYYSINYEEIHKPNNEIKKIHYIGGGNSLAAIYIIDENNNGQMYYMLTDHLGSITGLIDETTGDFAANNGNKQEFSYDAWGRRRNPDTWQCYDFILLTQQFNNSLISRGYTGHEHMDMFALINMNGRLYDPILGRVLSPDNFVQNPESSQGFNRYSYCGNNPLIYVDPDGQWFVIDDLIAAGAGFAFGYLSHGITTGDWGWKAVAAGGIGALTAWVGLNTCGASIAAAGIQSSTWNFVGNLAINSIVSQIIQPINIPSTNNFSMSFSPSFMLGSEGFSFGMNLGGTYRADLGNGNFANIGFDFTGLSHEYRFGGGIEVGGSDFALGAYSTYYGTDNGHSQRVGGLSLRSGDWGVRIEEDGGPWGWGKILADNNDRGRTFATSISYKDYSIGANFFTGEFERYKESNKPVFCSDDRGNEVFREITSPRLGAFYFGKGNYRFGVNSERGRAFAMDKTHDLLFPGYGHFENLCYPTKPYFSIQFRYRYSLW